MNVYNLKNVRNIFTYFTVGCRSDNECSPREACINDQCVDACSLTQCGINALCDADGYHRARCYCPDGYIGNPQVSCVRPECTTDQDCASFLACRNTKCIDPCDCPSTAQCSVVNHRSTCRCPPGLIGNPYESCQRGIFFFTISITSQYQSLEYLFNNISTLRKSSTKNYHASPVFS